MGFLDSVFGSGSSGSTAAKAPSKYEKAISQVVSEEAKASQPLFNELVGQSRNQAVPYNNQLFDQYLGSLGAYNDAFTPEMQGQQIAGWMQGLNDYGMQDQGIQQQLMQMLQSGGNATPEQIALIQQIAQNATNMGLSDLGAFQQRGIDAVREAAAGRGLRPGDTPILNEFGNTLQEYGRQAQQLVGGIQNEALQQQLAYPLQANQLQLQGLTSASDIANRRAQFQANLASEAQNNALNYGRGLTSTGMGLAQNNGAESLSPLVSSRQFQSGNVSQTAAPSAFGAATSTIDFLKGLAKPI